MQIKCKFCGCNFGPTPNLHYIARDNMTTGVSTVIKNDEGNLYDAFDCPFCGCQVIAQERKRVYVAYVEAEDNEEEIENE